MRSMAEPRMSPLPPDERDPRAEEVLARLRGGGSGDLNLFATLARHPRLFQRWSAFGGTLAFNGELPARERELLILRTAANTGAAYEWGHHVPIARRAGVTDDEIARLAVLGPPDPGGWAPEDEALVRAADELHADNRISDETWARLAARLGERELIEVCMLVGLYHLVAYTLRSLDIQPEPGLDPLPFAAEQPERGT
jgi:4-carboxymuconolactone decarboxylase